MPLFITFIYPLLVSSLNSPSLWIFLSSILSASFKFTTPLSLSTVKLSTFISIASFEVPIPLCAISLISFAIISAGLSPPSRIAPLELSITIASFPTKSLLNFPTVILPVALTLILPLALI